MWAIRPRIFAWRGAREYMRSAFWGHSQPPNTFARKAPRFFSTRFESFPAICARFRSPDSPGDYGFGGAAAGTSLEAAAAAPCEGFNLKSVERITSRRCNSVSSGPST